MELRTFRGKTMADALSAVKRELGKDAVIVHTRAFKLGGVVGLGARNVVEIIAGTGAKSQSSGAAEQSSSVGEENGPAEGAPAEGGWERPVRMRRAPTMGESRPSAPQTPSGAELLHVRKRRAAALEASPDGGAARRLARLAADVVPIAGRGPDGQPLAAEAAVRLNLEAEVAEIRRMVEQVLRAAGQLPSRDGAPSAECRVPGAECRERTESAGNPAHEGRNLPEALFRQYLKLLEGEVTRELCDQIVAAVRAELTDERMGDEGAVREAVLRQIAALIPVAQRTEAPMRGPDGRPRVIALVGPTGVGKTTTVAKLAAAYRLRHGRTVGLVTCDTYRIGAVDQLRTYANIIGVPLKVVLTPEEMGDACRDLAKCDVILIDTAGRSPSDEPRLEELRSFLDAACPHETHLVLSGVSSQAVMLHTAERFRAVGCDKVIFTKLDEAVHFGVLVNVARAIDAELSFVTTGQEVPDHIEAGRADRLARLVLEGALT